jgi:hypothetical protein
MQPDQRRRQMAYRLRRHVVGGVDNEPIAAFEHEAAMLEARRRALIAETAQRRQKLKSVQRAMGIVAALGVLALAVALGALV